MLISCQAAIVFQVHVTFNYIDENGENQTHMVNNHCSWQMTKLFISPITATTDCTPFYTQHDAPSQRQSVAASLQVVNGNGGWDVIGWCRRGEVADASANQEAGNKVANMNQPIHISYLYPSSTADITQIEQMRFIPSYIKDRELDS
jgi:hypothetical protein